MTLFLTEIFTSVQGESTFAGLPTTFVRLSGCNLRCTWCDTTYSFKKGQPYEIPDLLDDIARRQTPYVCITGGEPLLQKAVFTLMESLLKQDRTVSLETGGGVSTEGVPAGVHTILDVKCPGSGMSDKNVWENLPRLRPHDEVKFVIRDRLDYLWARDVCAKEQLKDKLREGKLRALLFSPVFETLAPKELAAWILEDALPVRLNLQLHKFIWPHVTQGV